MTNIILLIALQILKDAAGSWLFDKNCDNKICYTIFDLFQFIQSMFVWFTCHKPNTAYVYMSNAVLDTLISAFQHWSIKS